MINKILACFILLFLFLFLSSLYDLYVIEKKIIINNPGDLTEIKGVFLSDSKVVELQKEGVGPFKRDKVDRKILKVGIASYNKKIDIAWCDFVDEGPLKTKYEGRRNNKWKQEDKILDTCKWFFYELNINFDKNKYIGANVIYKKNKNNFLYSLVVDNEEVFSYEDALMVYDSLIVDKKKKINIYLSFLFLLMIFFIINRKFFRR